MLMLYNSPKKGFFASSIIILLSIIGNGMILHFKDLNVYSDVTNLDITLFKTEIETYIMFYSHMASYYVGLLTGYLITSGFVLKDKFKIRMAWFACSVYLTLYAIYFQMRIRGESPVPRFEAIVFGSIRKPMLAFCFSWIYYAIVIKQSWIIEWVFSWKQLLPVSRMFASINLVHMLIITYLHMIARYPVDYSPPALVSQTLSLLVLSIIYGYWFFILFESPFVILTNALLQKLMGSKPESQTISVSKTMDSNHNSMSKESKQNHLKIG
jgi:hypothetical protein